MSITKRQHYIPRSVIKYFSNDEKYIYECQIKAQGKYYKTNINNSMCARNIYEHKLLKTNAVENFFANTIDAELGRFHLEAISLLNQSNISEAKICFSNYAISILRCYYRSGAILEEYNTAYRSQKGEIILHILTDTPNNYLKGIRNTILNGYRFAILKNVKIGFILGDSYLSTTALGVKSRFSNASNRQIGFKNTMILLPLSSVYCLVFYHGNKPSYISENIINYISDSECLEVNLAIYQSSYNKVIGNNPNMLSTTNSATFDNNLNMSPVTTVMKFSNGKTIGHVIKRESFFTRGIMK